MRQRAEVGRSSVYIFTAIPIIKHIARKFNFYFPLHSILAIYCAEPQCYLDFRNERFQFGVQMFAQLGFRRSKMRRAANERAGVSEHEQRGAANVCRAAQKHLGVHVHCDGGASRIDARRKRTESIAL